MNRFRMGIFASSFVILVAIVAAAPAQTGGAYHIDGAVIAGGGATLDGGAFHLSGTAGQPATRVLTGASLRLYDGFWTPARDASDAIFADGFDD